MRQISSLLPKRTFPRRDRAWFADSFGPGTTRAKSAYARGSWTSMTLNCCQVSA